MNENEYRNSVVKMFDDMIVKMSMDINWSAFDSILGTSASNWEENSDRFMGEDEGQFRERMRRKAAQFATAYGYTSSWMEEHQRENERDRVMEFSARYQGTEGYCNPVSREALEDLDRQCISDRECDYLIVTTNFYQKMPLRAIVLDAIRTNSVLDVGGGV